MDGPRHIWWNFVSSTKERIDQAKNDWKAGRFDKVFGDEERLHSASGVMIRRYAGPWVWEDRQMIDERLAAAPFNLDRAGLDWVHETFDG